MFRSKSVFMLRKMVRDLTSQPPKIFEDSSEELSYYYLLFSENPKKLNRLISTFDKNGVPLNNAYIDVENPRLHYYPISIGQYALALYHSWLNDKEEEKRAHFLRIADWFMKNAIIDQRLGAYWVTDIPKPEYNVTAPWKSGFSQSRALSVLLRAWKITGDHEYYNMAVLSLKPYHFDISEGGIRVGQNGNYMFEEYVAALPTRVLDGAIFSLLGIWDFVRASEKIDPDNHSVARQIFQNGIIGLKHWLPKFDMGYWVYYNRCEIPGYPTNDPCTIGYLKLVTTLLTILRQITEDPFFESFREKFRSYLRVTNVLRMYRQKYIALKKLNRL